jgi:hypothetical protein
MRCLAHSFFHHSRNDERVCKLQLIITYYILLLPMILLAYINYNISIPLAICYSLCNTSISRDPISYHYIPTEHCQKHSYYLEGFQKHNSVPRKSGAGCNDHSCSGVTALHKHGSVVTWQSQDVRSVLEHSPMSQVSTKFAAPFQ